MPSGSRPAAAARSGRRRRRSGWGRPRGLWKSTMAAARCIAAIRKTSRGWTRLASSVLVDTISVRSTRCFAQRLTMPTRSTGWPRSWAAVARRPPAARRLRSGRGRVRVRRPSSTPATTMAACVGVMPLIRARSPVLSCASCCTFPHASRRAPARLDAVRAHEDREQLLVGQRARAVELEAFAARQAAARPQRVRAAPGHERLRRRARFRRHRRRAARDRGLFDPWRSTGSLASHSATPRAAAWPPCASSTRRSAASGLRLAAARSRVSASPPFAGSWSIHSSHITVPAGVTR